MGTCEHVDTCVCVGGPGPSEKEGSVSLHPAVNLPPPAQGLGDPPGLGRGLPGSLLVSWLTLPLLTQHQLAEDLPSLAWTGHQALPSSSLPFRRWWAIKRCPNDHCSCQILRNQCPGESLPGSGWTLPAPVSRKCGPVRGMSCLGAQDGLGPGLGLRCQLSVHPSPLSWPSRNWELGHL